MPPTTSSMVYDLPGKQPKDGLSSSPPARRSEFPSRIGPLLALFISLLLTVPLIDFGVYYLYEPTIEQNTYSNLRLIAKIKVVQYERWRESRKGDAEVLVADKSLAEQVQAFQTRAATEAGHRIGERFDALIAAYDYEGISLLDQHGDEIIHRGTTIAADAIQRSLMQQTLATGKVSNSDMYLAGNNRIQLDVMAPVTVRVGTQANIIGFVIIHTGIDRLILPRILSWPSASSTAEVLIVSANDTTENIISASHKNKKQTAVTMRALSTDSPYNSSRQLQKGKDYHGKTIFSVHEPLNKSAWSIITQIDQKEVLAPLTTVLLWVSLIALIAVSLVAFALTTLWRQQRRTHELQLIADSTERDRLLERFYDLPFVGMGIISAGSRLWTQANDRLCEILGYTRTELLQRTYNQITHPDDVVADLEYYECFVRRDIKYYQHEKRFLHKSGKDVFARVVVNCAYTPAGDIEMLLIAVEDITERKQAEEALRESQERLSLIIRGTNEGWWDLDLVRNGAYHSPRWWAMLGYEPDQGMTDPTLWQRITHPDDIEPSLKLIREVLASQKNSYEIELRLLHKDGHYVPILTRAFILRNQQGQAVRISGSNMDLTQRHAEQAALRNQEEFNRVLLENQAEGVVACDADLKLVLFNRTAREWHGLDAASIPPEQWSRHYGLYDAKGEHELTVDQIPLIRAFNGEHLQNVGMSINAIGQQTRFVSCSAAAFFDASGKKLGAVAIFRDMTSMLRHSQTLQASETLYREMFAANPLPMWVFDVETLAFLAVNDATINHYGWSREEFLAMKITDICPADEVKRLEQYLSHTPTKDLNTSGEWRHLKKDNTVMDVEITSHSLSFSGRDARLVLAYDITERKHNEGEVRLLNRLLLMLTNINQTLIRRLEPIELFNEACAIAVRDGGFLMAWIGLIEAETGLIKDVGHAGAVGDYLETLRLDLNDLGKYGPTARSIREGIYIVCNDIATDESFVPWREKALANGYRSMIALPLRLFGKIIGNLNLYSAVSEIFNQRELNLLDELAGNISFALEVNEMENRRQAAQKALQESETLFHTLASSSPVGIFRTNKLGHGVYYNESWSRITGITKSDTLGCNNWSESLHEEDRASVFATIDEAVKNQHGFSMEYRFLRPDGSTVWVKGQAEAETDTEGNFNGFVGTLTDITALKTSEESLRMAAAVFENTREGVMVTDADNRIILVNRAFTDITLYQEQDVLGQSPALLVSGRHDQQFYEELWQTLTEIGYWQGEIWNRRGDGDVHPVLMGISAIKNEAGLTLNYVAVFADISNLKASEAQLEFLAHHDPLTRLPNRLMLISQLGHAIEVARRDKSQLALLMLDLDRFKNVNDSFGHPAGDELLQQVAKRLSEKLRGVDTITRLGGDEFTVLLQNVAHPEDAARVAENIIDALQAPWTLANNIEVRISASVGISLYPGHGETALELLQHADAALYQAKSAGRGCARYFSESLTKAARDRFDIEARLRLALQNNELRVYYQPKIDMFSGKIIGAEALVRWQDPVEGLILPMRFISIAEDTGLIGAIGAWVMHEACRQGKSWLDSGVAPLSMAVNLSANQLHHGDIVETVSKILEETGFPTHLLELELTESILMQREDEMIDALNDLRSKGVRLAIDDFGTGYSSLAYLKSFPLDVLKVDRSFVADIEQDEDDRAITATIIGIAHTLGMKVVAEGVETVHQREFLRAHGCDMYQGYLVCKPLPAEEFAVFLQVYNAANQSPVSAI